MEEKVKEEINGNNGNRSTIERDVSNRPKKCKYKKNDNSSLFYYTNRNSYNVISHLYACASH